ncbi:hypothetical protein [Yersinia sp. 2466 StPb PI]
MRVTASTLKIGINNRHWHFKKLAL